MWNLSLIPHILLPPWPSCGFWTTFRRCYHLYKLIYKDDPLLMSSLHHHFIAIIITLCPPCLIMSIHYIHFWGPLSLLFIISYNDLKPFPACYNPSHHFFIKSTSDNDSISLIIGLTFTGHQNPGSRLVIHVYGTAFTFTFLHVNMHNHRNGYFYGYISIFWWCANTPRVHDEVANSDQSSVPSSTRSTTSALP